MRYAEQLAAAALILLIAPSGPGLAAPRALAPIKIGSPTSMAPEIALVGRRVYTAEGRQVGHVDAVETDEEGGIVSVDVVLGNILALGPRTVRVPGDKIARTGLDVRLAVTAEEIRVLPGIDEGPE